MDFSDFGPSLCRMTSTREPLERKQQPLFSDTESEKSIAEFEGFALTEDELDKKLHEFKGACTEIDEKTTK